MCCESDDFIIINSSSNGSERKLMRSTFVCLEKACSTHKSFSLSQLELEMSGVGKYLIAAAAAI